MGKKTPRDDKNRLWPSWRKVGTWFLWWPNDKPKYPEPISKDQYWENFSGNSLVHAKTKHEVAFQQVIENRRFEIDLYWKRATYFWAFNATAFGGFLAISSAESAGNLQFEIFALICVGLVLAFSWLFTNVGSKLWQRQWESHLDLLEDKITGPLYKTVHAQISFSVSKINDIVSAVFCGLWFILALRHLVSNQLLSFPTGNIRWEYLGAIVIVIVSIVAMFFGHGRGRFQDRSVRMYRRVSTIEDTGETREMGE